MADESQGQTHLAPEILQQPQHLGLGRNIEARYDLVGDHEIGLQDHRTSNADALPLTARQFVRVAVHESFRQTDAFHDIGHQHRRLIRIRGHAMQERRSGQDAADRVAWVERGHWVLEDHLHPPPQWP